MATGTTTVGFEEKLWLAADKRPIPLVQYHQRACN